MDSSLVQHFSIISAELCNLLYSKEYEIAKVNSLIDELNSKPFKAVLFVRKEVSIFEVMFTSG